MRSILDTIPAAVVGALQVHRTERGVEINRLPPDAATESGDMMLMWTGTVPSGVSIELDTDADTIEVVVAAQGVELDGRPMGNLPAIDVVVGDEVHSQPIRDLTLIKVERATLAIEHVPGGPDTLRFDLQPTATSRRVEIWLPNSAVGQLVDVRIPDHAVAAPAVDERPRWIHYGSSISQSGEASSPTRTWLSQVARRHGLQLTSLGLAGQCQLDQFIARAIASRPADLISLKLGINIINADSMRERVFVPAVHAFLDTVRAGHPTTPLLVVSPIFCPSAETHPGPTVPLPDGRFVAVPRSPELMEGALTLVRIRELLAAIVAARRAAGDQALHYLDGLELFGAADAHLLPDDLHPADEGYALMAERFSDLAFDQGPFG